MREVLHDRKIVVKYCSNPDGHASEDCPDFQVTSCPTCGWEDGDGHNWEAHTAEMRADEYRQYEYAMGYHEEDWLDG
jgi:hypothetical protein